MGNWLKFRLQEEAGADGADAGEGADAGSADAGAAEGGEGDVSRGTDEGANGDEGVKGYWPDDWMANIAGEDEKLAKKLGRYTDPKAAIMGGIAAQDKLRSGEHKKALPDKPTEDDVKAYRKEHGIPESADKYDLKFDSGLVIGEDDQPIIDTFLESAHGQNYTPAQAKAAVEWYYQEQDRQEQAQQEQDGDQRQEAMDALNVEWGANFRPNINRVEGLLSKFPDEIRDELKSARLPDGSALFNNPEVLRGFAALALEIDPAGTIVPGGDGNPMKGITEEKAEIEKVMRENRKAYDKDEPMQARYRELIEAEQKLKKRG